MRTYHRDLYPDHDRLAHGHVLDLEPWRDKAYEDQVEGLEGHWCVGEINFGEVEDKTEFEMGPNDRNVHLQIRGACQDLFNFRLRLCRVFTTVVCTLVSVIQERT